MEIRRLTPDDVGAVLRLAGLAGWNQTARDIERLLALEPDGCFIARAAEQVVGSTTTTTYGTDLAWVGMVLVDPEFRRRGIATALMEKALGSLRDRGVRTIKLDATPAGRPVYERLGFEPECLLERWAGVPTAGRAPGVSSGAWEDIAAPDRVAFGTDRGSLLRRLIDDTGLPLVARGAHGEVTGYAFARPGTRAGYVGPVVAVELPDAQRLLSAAFARLGDGPVFIDVDPGFPGSTDLLVRLGFSRQRELLRMRLGPPIPAGPFPRVFAIGGPEIG